MVGGEGVDHGGVEGGVVAGDDVTDESVAGVVVVVDCHCGVGDVGVGGEGCFDFAEFDAVAADFDLEVAAAEVFEVAVGVPADEVAGAVHAFA
ncbi:hypothetical protein, partial [Rhodococcus opacus]|uniref:hypothetical protein n=1 Tax=Rhodococcus opacus TaxID=37919 RepID=UPI003AF8394C